MRLIPAQLRGRVFALLRTLMQATPPIGAVIAGLLLTGGDLIPAIVVMAAFMVIPASVAIVARALSAEVTGEVAAVSRSAGADAGSSA